MESFDDNETARSFAHLPLIPLSEKLQPTERGGERYHERNQSIRRRKKSSEEVDELVSERETTAGL